MDKKVTFRTFPSLSLQGHSFVSMQVSPFHTVPLGHTQPGLQISDSPNMVSHFPRKWHFSWHEGAHAVGIFGDVQVCGVAVVMTVIVGVVDGPMVGVAGWLLEKDLYSYVLLFLYSNLLQWKMSFKILQ